MRNKKTKPVYVLVGTPTVPRYAGRSIGWGLSSRGGNLNTVRELVKEKAELEGKINPELLGIDLNLLRNVGRKGWKEKIKKVNQGYLTRRKQMMA